MKQFIMLFNKVGGKEILRQYRCAHVLFFALIITTVLGFSRKSLEIVRLAVDNRILSKMRKKYQRFISDYKKNEEKNLSHNRSNKVWIMWLQGMEQAPLLVQKCYYSLQENLKDKEIILLTDDNYRDYVQFPDFIQKKIDTGVISRTHMSDLIRLELLIIYGGTWIDATVFCSNDSYPNYIFDSDLFVYQCLKPGRDGQCKTISSWFMTACTNNPIILLTRALLYKYWSSHNMMIDYFLIHDCFELAIEAYPEEWNKVIPFSNSTVHILLLRLFEEFDAKTWEALKEQTSFHKMTYKFEEEQTKLCNTYYSKIFGEEEIR